MKKFNVMFGVIGFFLMMTTPSFATNLLGSDPYWPSQPPEAGQGMNSELRRSIGGFAAGGIIGKLVSSDPVVALGTAVIGGVLAGEWDAHTKKREAALIAAQPSKNCRVVTRVRTNPKTGQPEGGYDETCDEMRHRDLPYAEMIPPGTASYKHDSEQVTDPLALLPEEERSAVIELRKRQSGEYSDEERQLIEEHRKQKQVKPTSQSGTASPTALLRTSYTPGCSLYVNGQMNPGC